MTTIKLFATLRQLAGAKEITVPFEEGTARELIQAISEVNPVLGSKILNSEGEISGTVHLFVHGRNIVWLQGLDTTITKGQQLILIPPVAGGRGNEGARSFRSFLRRGSENAY